MVGGEARDLLQPALPRGVGGGSEGSVVGGGRQLRLFRAVLSVKAETLVGPQSVTAAERNRNPSGRVASFRPRSADFCSAGKKKPQLLL